MFGTLFVDNSLQPSFLLGAAGDEAVTPGPLLSGEDLNSATRTVSRPPTLLVPDLVVLLAPGERWLPSPRALGFGQGRSEGNVGVGSPQGPSPSKKVTLAHRNPSTRTQYFFLLASRT